MEPSGPCPGENARENFGTLAASGARLGVPDGLVGEVGDAALEGLGADEAHGFLVACLPNLEQLSIPVD